MLICSAFIPMSLGYNIKLSDIEQPSMLINKGKILYVGGDGPGNYTKIQDAIDNASKGDTVFVYDDSSPYYENVIVNKSVNLIGEDKNTTLIEGIETNGVAIIDSEGVSINGFTIRYGIPNPPRLYWGIYVNGGHGDGWKSIIFDNIITNTNTGICLVDTSQNSVFDNILMDNTYGIAVADSWGACGQNLVCHNEIYNCETGILIGGKYGDVSFTYVYENIIWHNHEGIHIGHGLIGGGLKYNRVYSNSILYNEVGLRIYSPRVYEYVSYNHIYWNNFIGNMESNAYFEGKPGTNYWDDNGFGNYWHDYQGDDEDHDGIGDTPYIIQKSLFITNKDNYPSMQPYGDFDPNAPNTPKINGSTNPEPEVEYEYTFVTTDPNSDDVFYYISWGDGTYNEWIGPFASGKEVTRSHTWTDKKNCVIIAQAKDTNGLVGCWGTLPIFMPRNRVIFSSLVIRFFDMFPTFKKIIFILLNKTLGVKYCPPVHICDRMQSHLTLIEIQLKNHMLCYKS